MNLPRGWPDIKRLSDDDLRSLVKAAQYECQLRKMRVWRAKQPKPVPVSVIKSKRNERIYTLRMQGWKMKQLCAEFDLTENHIRDILKSLEAPGITVRNGKVFPQRVKGRP